MKIDPSFNERSVIGDGEEKEEENYLEIAGESSGRCPHCDTKITFGEWGKMFGRFFCPNCGYPSYIDELKDLDLWMTVDEFFGNEEKEEES